MHSVAPLLAKKGTMQAEKGDFTYKSVEKWGARTLSAPDSYVHVCNQIAGSKLTRAFKYEGSDVPKSHENVKDQYMNIAV